MGTFLQINRWLLIALAALGVAFYFSMSYVQQIVGARRSAAVTPQSSVGVVVTKAAIPGFTPITASEVTVEQLPKADVPPGAFSSPSQLIGKWAKEAVAQQVPVVSSDVFSPQSPNILATQIHPGDMAVDLPLGATYAVDGIIEPGDTISLFTTIKEKNGQQVSEDFLNQIRVLAVNGSMAPPAKPTTGQGLTLILALPPNDISKLLFVQQKGPVEAVLDAPGAKTVPPTPYGTLNWQTPVP